MKEGWRTDGLCSEFLPACSQTLSLIQSDPIHTWWGNGYYYSLRVAFPFKFRHAGKLLQCISKILPTCVCTLYVEHAPSNFHVLIHNPSLHRTNMLTFTCCASQAKPPPQKKTNTHLHTQIHTWKTQPCVQVGIVMRHVTAPGRRKGSSLYWSAICGTNSFATHPCCLTNSQIPGMSWHPAATGSVLYFHCSEKCTPTADVPNMPKTCAKKWMYCAPSEKETSHCCCVILTKSGIKWFN